MFDFKDIGTEMCDGKTFFRFNLFHSFLFNCRKLFDTSNTIIKLENYETCFLLRARLKSSPIPGPRIWGFTHSGQFEQIWKSFWSFSSNPDLHPLWNKFHSFVVHMLHPFNWLTDRLNDSMTRFGKTFLYICTVYNCTYLYSQMELWWPQVLCRPFILAVCHQPTL